MFAGSDGGGDNCAVIATLIGNCKLNGINPHNLLTSTLTEFANGHSANDVGNLMPWTAVAEERRIGIRHGINWVQPQQGRRS